MFQGNSGISPLTKGTDQQQHRRPVNPAAPKTHRWRQHTAPTTGTAAAQAKANFKSFFKIRGPTPRLSQVVGTMQRTPAKGQRRDRVRLARSWSILKRRENNDLRLRISSGIIVPAIYCDWWQEPPTTNRTRNARGLHHISLAVLVYFLPFFHLFLGPRSIRHSAWNKIDTAPGSN